MANKPLKSIVFPGLSDTYTIPQSASDIGAIEAPASPSDGDVLTYDSNAGEWVASAGGGGPSPATSTPSPMANTAAVGTSTKYAREDHVHRSEIYWATYNSTTFTTILNLATGNTERRFLVKYNNRTYELNYHASSATSFTFYCYNNYTIYWVSVSSGNVWSNGSKSIPSSEPSAYTSNPAALGTASPGSSTSWARGDHVHAMPSAADVGAVAVAQGVAHAGEFVVVGSDGNVTTMTLATWQGGSY